MDREAAQCRDGSVTHHLTGYFQQMMSCAGDQRADKRSFKCVLRNPREDDHMSADLRWADAGRVGRKGLTRLPSRCALSRASGRNLHPTCARFPHSYRAGSVNSDQLCQTTYLHLFHQQQKAQLWCAPGFTDPVFFVCFLCHCFQVVIISFHLLVLGLIYSSSSHVKWKLRSWIFNLTFFFSQT